MFLNINGFPNYSINEEGVIMNSGIVMKHYITDNGYCRIALYNGFYSKHFLVHRLVAIHHIQNPLKLKVVDHIDHDKENNCISNLRWCTHSQNGLNSIKRKNCSSQYKGVHKHGNYWRVRFVIFDGIRKSFGCYKTEEEAARVYNHNCTTFHIKNILPDPTPTTDTIVNINLEEIPA